MKLTAPQIDAFDRDGFLIFPDLIAPEEVALLKRELARVSAVPDERIIREKDSSTPRVIYGLPDLEGPTGSPAYHQLARDARILEPGSRHDHGIDAPILDELAIEREFVGTGIGAGDDQIEPGLRQPGADRGDEAQIEGFAELSGAGRQHDPDRVAAATLEPARGGVCPVADPLRFRLDPLAGRFGHVAVPTERARHGGDGQAKSGCDSGQGHDTTCPNANPKRFGRSIRQRITHIAGRR